MTERQCGTHHYSAHRDGETRQRIRESLERFEPPGSVVPEPVLSAEGTIAYALPLPAKFAFEELLRLLRKNDIGVGASEEDTYKLILSSGAQLEFWPIADDGAQLKCSGIAAADDAVTGARFRDVVAAITLLHQDMPALQVRAAAAAKKARQQTIIATLSEAEFADLGGAVAILQNSDYEVALAHSPAAAFSARVTRLPDLSYSFDDLGRFLNFARKAAQSAETAPAAPITQRADAKLDSQATGIVARRSRPMATILLLILALALFAALTLYPGQR